MDSIFTLPPDLPLWISVALIVVSAATSFVTAAFGIGGGIILIAILAVLLPAPALIPVHGAVQFGSNAGRTLIMLKYVRWSTVFAFTAGSIIGAGVGGAIFVQIPGWIVQTGIAIFILWSVFGKVPAVASGHVLIAGAFSSFLTMFIGATGVFISAMVKTMRLDPLDHVATHSVLMTVQHLIKVIAFGLLGFAFGPYALLIVLMIASGFLGTVIGKQVLTRMNKAQFQRILDAILVLLSLRLLWTALEGYLGRPLF